MVMYYLAWLEIEFSLAMESRDAGADEWWIPCSPFMDMGSNRNAAPGDDTFGFLDAIDTDIKTMHWYAGAGPFFPLTFGETIPSSV